MAWLPTEQFMRQIRVLGDPTRFVVLVRLLDGPQTVRQLNTALKMEQSLLSHHLKSMRDSGLVVNRRKGRYVIYEIAPELRDVAAYPRQVDLGCCLLSFKPRQETTSESESQPRLTTNAVKPQTFKKNYSPPLELLR